MAWIKFASRMFSHVLTSFSSYEYGKNSELENNQLVLAANLRKIESQKISEPTEDNTAISIWILVGIIILAIIVILIKELVKCIRFRVQPDLIQMQQRANPNENQNANQNAGMRINP